MLPVGLGLSRRLFQREVAPRLGDLPVAAGLVGEGSDCFGFDDEVSRDHDWGPALCLWRRREDPAAPLEAILAELPPTFEGFPVRATPGRTGVLETGAFYRRFTGLERPPETAAEWLAIPEHALAACTNGEVFADPPGAFTAHRAALLAHYPGPVRLHKLAACLEAAAQSGQYNLPRALRRGDAVAAALARAAFLRHAMGAAYLLARRYRPFSKWMHRALPDRDLAGELEAIARGDDARVEAAAARLIGSLRGLTASRDTFLLAHARELRRGLDRALLALNPGLEG
ncbi:DUF4037 domain-containing protein [Mesoterricola silvestris]|uniref:DUF4037 domain-containing protein n=1 Tax=Mesoterricola silvestris TaxID=2927979 RepID=A0AA48K906_9BACT|nr:DUF4037 domain-containing protein [Mesoterricola silvestris]BDU71827.1 hypothetical protein METEAL_10010 [Mesoterricola silvestris]